MRRKLSAKPSIGMDHPSPEIGFMRGLDYDFRPVGDNQILEQTASFNEWGLFNKTRTRKDIQFELRKIDSLDLFRASQKSMQEEEKVQVVSNGTVIEDSRSEIGSVQNFDIYGSDKVV